jgi:hypothetical protein
MCDMAGLLPCIPQLHGMLFATRILVVLRSGVPSDSSRPRSQRMACPQPPLVSTDDVKACSSMIFR